MTPDTEDAPIPLNAAPAAAESLHDAFPPPPFLKLIGVGGAGVSVASRLSADAACAHALSLAVMDCDARKLETSPISEKHLLGARERRGLSTGGEVELGRRAAEQSREALSAAHGGADLLFLVAGLGGGTASAAAPLLAAEASKAGSLVIGFALLPFSFEGGRRTKQAAAALVPLRRACDAVIVLPNDLLHQDTAEGTTALAAFAHADGWIARAVCALCGLLCKTGLMNIDFAALQRAFEYRGSKTVFGLGHGTGENAASEVLATLRACPLLHAPETARRADRLLVSVSGSTAVLTLTLLNTLVQAVSEQFGKAAELIVGATLDDALGDRVELCLVGTSDIGGNSRKQFKHSNTESLAATEARPSRSEGEKEAASQSRASTVADRFIKGSATADTGGASVSQVTGLQDEFGFSADAQGGYFQHSEATFFEGENLDQPTFQRKGVRIAL